ncbi:hypothetical protein GCK72_016515 [Caenorhabditis remanei]|uniref:Uncharacterized protein n=1 Tax=Caenorhabditis remanei TaxID=31234 RepID=A0A6A5G4U8_CAERE|nr:hypothetical protein GCK72_016515 [Caenorhabditis remanei]KAF1749970.1 hypothetical protein GCK72_016515 [Caenorhabditis remanei]
MALIIPIIFTLVLLLIVKSYKRIVWIFKVNEYGKRLPGPPTQSLFGNVGSFADKDTIQMLDYIVETANEYRKKGEKIMRLQFIGKLLVLPLDGKTAQTMLQSTTELDKGDDYEFPRAWLGRSVLLDGYGERWKSHRKLVTPTFHFAKLEGYLEVFNRETKVMIDLLENYATSGETVDLFHYIKRCTLDVICGTAMGITVDAQHNPTHPYVEAVEGFNKLSVDFIFWLLGYQKQKDDYVQTMKKFTGDVTAERRAALASGEVEQHSSKRDMNFLDILLCSNETKDWTEEDIREEVDTFMFAGHDTTATSFSWLCWNLAHNPDIQEKVYEEIIGIFGENPEGDVTSEDLKKLDYTERVLKESKRRIAPVPVVQRKLREDMEIGGHKIPAGVNVSISPSIFHCNPEVFPNPETFDPDRFLPENMDKRNAYDYIPFSAGLRNCVGQKFAQLNEKVLLIHMLKNYRIEPMLGFMGTRPTMEIVSKPSNGIPVKLIKR